MSGPRTAQGIVDEAMRAAKEAVSERLSGGRRSSSGSGGKKVISLNLRVMCNTVLCCAK